MSASRNADRLDRKLFPYTQKRLELDGHELAYVDEGKGPPLLMLHGNPTWSFLYRDVIAGLRERFRCIAPDLPGFGFSTPAAGFGFRPSEHSQVIERFIEALDLRDITLMVHDWGGPIGFAAATRHPERFSAFVIGNTWAWPKADPVTRVASCLLGGPLGGYLILQRNFFVEKILPGSVKRRKLTQEVMDAYAGHSRHRSRVDPCTCSRARSSTADRSWQRSSDSSPSSATAPRYSSGQPRTSPSESPSANDGNSSSPTIAPSSLKAPATSSRRTRQTKS